VLAVSVVYRGCAIPVAWVILPAGAKRAWRREWLRLLRRLRPAIPPGWTVIVLADRGLYAPWLFRRLTRLGWHPFLRINTGGSFRPTGATCWRPLTTFAPRPGTSWRGAGIAFTRNQIPCTLLARWEDGYKDPWLILTDLAPEARDAGWYGMRGWIDQGVKISEVAGGWGGARDGGGGPGGGGARGGGGRGGRGGAGRWGGGGRRDVPRQHVTRRDRRVPGTPADTAGDPPAARERVSPRLGAAADS